MQHFAWADQRPLQDNILSYIALQPGQYLDIADIAWEHLFFNLHFNL